MFRKSWPGGDHECIFGERDEYMYVQTRMDPHHKLGEPGIELGLSRIVTGCATDNSEKVSAEQRHFLT